MDMFDKPINRIFKRDKKDILMYFLIKNTYV